MNIGTELKKLGYSCHLSYGTSNLLRITKDDKELAVINWPKEFPDKEDRGMFPQSTQANLDHILNKLGS